jgi:hypothetical protein
MVLGLLNRRGAPEDAESLDDITALFGIGDCKALRAAVEGRLNATRVIVTAGVCSLAKGDGLTLAMDVRLGHCDTCSN